MAVGHFTATDSSTFQIHAIDSDGFSNPEMADYQLIVRSDQMPTVQITVPTHDEECTPVAVVPLRGIAEVGQILISRVLIGTSPAVSLRLLQHVGFEGPT